MERMVDTCLIQEELARNPIPISDDELQNGMDAVRRAHQLYTEEQTEHWMRQRGFTQIQLEHIVSEHLTWELLRKRICEDSISAYLSAHLSEFDLVRIARIEFPDLDTASRIRAGLTGGAAGFLSAMHESFISSEAVPQCSFMTRRRRDIASEFDAQMFSVEPGAIVGPLHTKESYVLGCLLSLKVASDNDEIRTCAEQAIFDQWLAQRRSEAVVTWHWGRASGIL